LSAGWTALLRRWLKFHFVGAIGIVVQLLALVVLVSGFGVGYLPATALAVEVAVIHNFVWHERFTWAERRHGGAPEVLARLLRFNLTTGLISMLGNLALMRLLVGWARHNYLGANLITIALLSTANFLASDRLVFRPIHKRRP
jgi:putative flippase GtrA